MIFPQAQRPEGFIISIRSSSCEKRHSDPDNPDTAQQVPHGKHMLSLITAVGAGSSREAFCLFCSGLNCRGRGCRPKPHEKRFTRARESHERGCVTSHGGQTPMWSSIKEATVADCGFFLCLFVVSLVLMYR